MTATGHAIIGTVIAAKIGNPALAIPIALASHVVADAFPHWDVATNDKKKTRTVVLSQTVLDVLFGFLICYILLITLFPHTNLSYALLIIIAAQFFDWATAPYYFFKLRIPPFTWAYRFQKLFDHRLNKPWGIINQVAVLILLVVICKIF